MKVARVAVELRPITGERAVPDPRQGEVPVRVLSAGTRGTGLPTVP